MWFYPKRRKKKYWSGVWKRKKEKWRLAKEFRDNPTPAEARMWDLIRWEVNPVLPKGVFFRRQVEKYGYIIDFYCEPKCLGVEVDGSVHAGRENIDNKRHHQLKSRGVNLLHIKNEEVFNAFHAAAFVTQLINLCWR